MRGMEYITDLDDCLQRLFRTLIESLDVQDLVFNFCEKFNGPLGFVHHLH